MDLKQRYGMVFWRHAEKKETDFNEVAERVYKVLNVFVNNFPAKYRPNYLTVNKKSETKLYEWNFENFCKDLKINVNHTKGRVFKELGYSLSFFSSLNNFESFSYRIHVGATDVNFTNAIVINLSMDFDYFDKKVASKLEQIFYQCVKEFDAYYACMSNSQIPLRKGCYTSLDDVPNDVHWLNYWSDEILKKIDIKKLKKLEKKYKEFSFNNGFIKLQDIALNAENPKDLQYKEQIEQELGI